VNRSSIAALPSSHRRVAGLLVVFALAATLPLPSFAQDPAAGLPAGPEKKLFLKVCSGCHPAEAVLGRMDTPKNWARKVDSMINRGAVAAPAEVDQINAYLSRNFAFVPSQVHLPDGPGKEALQKVCGSCHPAEIVVNRDGHSGTHDHWAETIDRMLARGAKGTNEEFDQITTYLVANFGFVPVPSYLPNGPGKTTVERVCGPCHGVTLLIDRRASPGEWSRTVDGMMGRGAVATPAEAQEISDYLARYLGPKTETK
jgi:cytochrome c5